MNDIYILTIVKEAAGEHPEVEVSAHRNMDSALRAYEIAVDEAREEAVDYRIAHEDCELETETYRYFRIEDTYDGAAITIEIQAHELIGEDPEDI